LVENERLREKLKKTEEDLNDRKSQLDKLSVAVSITVFDVISLQPFEFLRPPEQPFLALWSTLFTHIKVARHTQYWFIIQNIDFIKVLSFDLKHFTITL
jgi:hypothetical protein